MGRVIRWKKYLQGLLRWADKVCIAMDQCKGKKRRLCVYGLLHLVTIKNVCLFLNNNKKYTVCVSYIINDRPFCILLQGSVESAW